MNNITPFIRPIESTVRTNSPSNQFYRVHLVNKMRATGPNGESILPKPKKTQALLAYLCLAEGELLFRDQVAGLLWDQAETQARNSLRHALQDLARLGWPLERRHETLRLDISSCWIDALEGPHRSDLLLASLHGISAPFDEWLAEERSRLERRWQSILEAELEELVAGSATPAQRAEAARRLQNLMPTHDYAVRNLMIAYADMGESANAIREYERFRMFIDRSIGVLPSEPTVALAETIRLASRKRSSLGMSRYDDTLPESDRDPVGAEAKRSLPQHPHPSIAVLFRNLAGSDDNLVEGLVEDLIETLSRVPGLFVVSRYSAAAFRNQDRLPREISDALGVRYLLLDSMRVIGDRLRLNVELIDASTDTALWRERRDATFSDLLEAQDRLVDGVVRAVATNLHLAEVSRVRTKRPEDYDAYDLFLRGQESMHNPSRKAFEGAENLFRSAIHRQPRYAAAMAWLAHWHVLRVGQGWSPDPARDTAQADYFAQQAVECDAKEPTAYAVQGHVAAYLHRDFDLAFARFEMALRINPNSARAWLWSAYANAWFNQGSIAVKNVERAIALAPYDPLIFTFTGGLALAHMADRQYDRAIEFALRCIQENPSYTTAHKVLICCLVLSGRGTEARNPAHQLLLLDPGFTVEKFRQSPASFGPLGELYCGAFAQAGVPLSD